jgi:hypothetical protein
MMDVASDAVIDLNVAIDVEVDVTTLDVARGLKQRFDCAVVGFLERYEVLPDEENITELSDEDAKAVEVLEALRDSVDAIPPSLIKATEELRDSNPELFEETFDHGVQVVGFGFFPTDATVFIETVNRTVQRDMACA